MRLLKDDGHGNLSLVEKYDSDIPNYAILSHTWGPDCEEVTFKDLMEGTGKNKTGYNKIKFCSKQAASDDLQYFWGSRAAELGIELCKGHRLVIVIGTNASKHWISPTVPFPRTPQWFNRLMSMSMSASSTPPV